MMVSFHIRISLKKCPARSGKTGMRRAAVFILEIIPWGDVDVNRKYDTKTAEGRGGIFGTLWSAKENAPQWCGAL